MFNYLEILGSQNLPIKADLSHLSPTALDGGCHLQKRQWQTLVWAVQPRLKSKRRFKAVLILWKHWLSMAC